MTTSNSENEPWANAHPLELLEAYALDALDEEESLQVEAHLDWCGPCSREAAGLQESLASLELIAERTQPPRELQARLMRSLESPGGSVREQTLEPARTLVGATSAGSRSNFWRPAVRFLLPVAAMVMVGLFSAAMVINARLSDRTQDLEQQNSTLTAQVGLSAADNQLMQDKLTQLQLTSYWLANPANEPLALRPSQAADNSKGVLLLAKDGSGAVIMVTNMKARTLGSTYQVYLMRQGNRVWAAEVKVDDQGWGTKAFWPKESLFRFDKIELVSQTAPGSSPSPADMIMEANIPGSLPSQMLKFPAWQ